MRKPIDQLYVEIFDWPDRFLVEADGPDTDYKRVFGIPDPDDDTPYLVDLGEFDFGWCGCTDFRIQILPRVERGAVGGYVQCKHLLAARDARRRMEEASGGTRPNPAPILLDFGPSDPPQEGGIVDDTDESDQPPSDQIPPSPS